MPKRRPEGATSQLSNGDFSLTAKQIAKLIGAAASARDALVIRLLAETGMRRAEVVDLRWRDVDCAERLVVVRNGKGRKMRVVPITVGLVSVLQRQREQAGDADFVFHSRQSEALSARQLNRIVSQTGQRAGIAHPNPRYQRITCHLFRHTFARLWKAQGGSIESLSKIFGHESVSTTWSVYGRESLTDIRENYAKTVRKIFG